MLGKAVRWFLLNWAAILLAGSVAALCALGVLSLLRGPNGYATKTELFRVASKAEAQHYSLQAQVDANNAILKRLEARLAQDNQ